MDKRHLILYNSINKRRGQVVMSFYMNEVNNNATYNEKHGFALRADLSPARPVASPPPPFLIACLKITQPFIYFDKYCSIYIVYDLRNR